MQAHSFTKTPTPTRSRVFSSLGMLCAPLAFHLAAVARDLPDGLYLMLVLSIWASLMSALVLAGCALKLLLGRYATRPAARARAWS